MSSTGIGSYIQADEQTVDARLRPRGPGCRIRVPVPAESGSGCSKCVPTPRTVRAAGFYCGFYVSAIVGICPHIDSDLFDDRVCRYREVLHSVKAVQVLIGIIGYIAIIQLRQII